MITTLKGHTTSVNAMAKFPEERAKHLIVSGSYDTTLKLWDIRAKNQLHQFKGIIYIQIYTYIIYIYILIY